MYEELPYSCLICGEEWSSSYYKKNAQCTCRACLLSFVELCDFKLSYAPRTGEEIKKMITGKNRKLSKKGKRNKWNREYHRNNPTQRVSHAMSSRMYKVLRKNKCGKSWQKLVGYSRKDLMKHLEAQFEPGMTWENFGLWHVHHRIPINAWQFTAYTDREFKQCWCLANLQPLWGYDNRSKGGRF